MADADLVRSLVLAAIADPSKDYGIHEIKDQVRASAPDTSLTDLMRALLTMSAEGRIEVTGSGADTRYSL
jgi:Fe2+ or Zn2+ uptake regulation protein